MSDATAKNYWETHPEAALANEWTANPIIGDAIYRRMTGGVGKWWLAWLMEDYFGGRRFKRMLSPGCGVGDHEIAIANMGMVEQIDAFDFSRESIRLASEKAAAAGKQIRFFVDDLNSFQVPADVKYDLIFCSGCVHHCRELERFFDVTSKALADDGYFVLNEYVGACFNIYPPRQVEIVNRLLAALPAHLKKSADARFVNATIQEAMRHDPSESVRSKLILPFLEQYFKVELRRDYGGCLTHLMYPLLNHARTGEEPKRGLGVALRLLSEFEMILVEGGVLETDFTLCVGRGKG